MVSTMVVPSPARPEISDQKSRRAGGRSRWWARRGRAARVGRRCRARRRAGVAARLRARGAAVALLGQPHGLNDLVDIARVPVDLRGARDDLAHRQQVEPLGGLQHDAEPLPPVEAGGRRVLPSTLTVAAVTAPEALEDLDGGRLAGAVGAEQREDLALVDLEVDAGDGRDASIAPCAGR